MIKFSGERSRSIGHSVLSESEIDPNNFNEEARVVVGEVARRGFQSLNATVLPETLLALGLEGSYPGAVEIKKALSQASNETSSPQSAYGFEYSDQGKIWKGRIDNNWLHDHALSQLQQTSDRGRLVYEEPRRTPMLGLVIHQSFLEGLRSADTSRFDRRTKVDPEDLMWSMLEASKLVVAMKANFPSLNYHLQPQRLSVLTAY